MFSKLSGTQRRETTLDRIAESSRWARGRPRVRVGFQSLEVRHDSVIREDSTGSFWQRPSRYMGSYLKIPVAGAEGRTSRYSIKPLYHPPAADGVWLDDRTDDLSARLTYTARYLT